MLIVIVLLTSLSLAVVRNAHADFKRARDTRLALSAHESGDFAAHTTLRDWTLNGGDTLAVGALLSPTSVSSSLGAGNAMAMRTSPTTYWTIGEGWAGDSVARTLSRARVNTAWRLAVPDIVINAALTARDSVTLAGGARVIGADTTLAAWSGGCPPLVSAPAIALPDTTRLCDGVCGAGSVGGRAIGTPALLTDAQAALASRYNAFALENWNSLTSHASLVLPGGSVVSPAPTVSAGSCNRIDPANWGDPLSSTSLCAHWFPLIWAQGDIELQGGVGQGILLADGDVTLSAGTRFFGIIIAHDDIVSAGTGSQLLGAALAGDTRSGAGDHTLLTSSTSIQHSSCAVQRALLGAARLRRVRDRPWMELR